MTELTRFGKNICIDLDKDMASQRRRGFLATTEGALAEFERNLIRERTQAGLQAARARGRKGGRRQKLTPQQLEIGRSLAADPKRSVTSICKHLGISRPTFYRYIHFEAKSEPTQKTTQVRLWLRVENNSKFIRRKQKVREWIEQSCLSPYQMKKQS